jgi:signal transduction histidine kinase
MKLLNRTIRNYLLYSVLLFLLCTPLFYFSIQKLFIREMDEVLRSHKIDFYEANAYLKTEEDLKFFQLMNREFLLTPSNTIGARDTLFTIELYDSAAAELVPYRVFSTSVNIHGRNYELQVRESLVSDISLVTAIMTIQVIMLFLLLLGLVLINRRLSRKIWDPFYVILDRLKKYQIDDGKELDLPSPSTAEFRDLSAAITQLVEENHSAYVNQKEFTENASHELQTPLAICRTKLELLAQTKELTHDQAELIGELFNGMDRMTHLNKGLLLLARIENRQFLVAEEVEINAAVRRSLESYQRQAQEKNLTVTVSIDKPVLISVNPTLMDVLIGNLVSNAIRHTPGAGIVIISADSNSMLISNSGSPLLYPDRIFERFQRESKTTLGTGLGLALVKKVCDVAGYKVAYHYSDSMHHFRVSF